MTPNPPNLSPEPMTNINFLQVGDMMHCLVCHSDRPRDDFKDHYDTHESMATIPCSKKCGQWFTPPKESKPLSPDVEARFDEKFPPFQGVGAPFPIFADTPNRQHLAAFLAEEIARAKQEGRDSLLKELGVIEFWNKAEIKDIQEKAKADAVREIIEKIKGRKHRVDNAIMTPEREAENRALNGILSLLQPPDKEKET